MNGHLKELIIYRLEQADESLQSARLLFENDKFRPAVNRSYYAMFYSVLALIVTENNSTSKHTGVISIFDKEYVKKGVFPREMSKWLHESFDLRQRADYTEMFTVSKERADELIRNSALFLASVRGYLKV
ncbi:MAG TPA: HEPN domain-containing protein [Spirochaetota bacterium]|nr:HEPN domain-containing protein [Spirochaetota bacterium]